MVIDWQESSVGEFSPFHYGKGLKADARRDGVTPVFGSNGIVGCHDEPLVNSPAIIVGRKGTVGAVHYSPAPCWPIDTTFYIVDEDPQRLRFKYYLLKSLGLEHMNADSAVPGLNRDAAHARSILIPPSVEQRAIAHILGTLDDKIELNRRINETLEAIARAIFKSWFVDFDPVRAKAEGRDTSLPKYIADLFPYRLVESELGKIPEGWGIGKVSDEFVVTMGQSPPGSTYNEDGDGLPFYQGRTDFGFRYPSRRVYCTAPKRIAEKDDTLVSVRAPVGDTNMAFERCCVGRGVAAVRHKMGDRSYTYYSMRSLRDDFDRFEAEGTVFGSIGKKDFNALVRIIPKNEVLESFEQLAGPIDRRIEANELQSQTLRVIRDTLLPKLISGELRVKDAERFLGGVVA